MTSSLSPEQIARRMLGITATDIAAIVSVHPYRSAVDIWLDKTGQAPAFDGNPRTKWGTLLEKPIRKDYEERHGVAVQTVGTLEAPHAAWMLATPDGIVFEPGQAEPARGLEIKCHTVHLAHLYGSPGTDEIPPHELCQCAWGMAVTGLPRWDLVPFIDGQTNDYIIDRDEELIEMLVSRAEHFRRTYIDTKTPPPPDGSSAYTEFLKLAHARDNVSAPLLLIDNNPELLAVVDKLRDLRDRIAGLEAEETRAVQAIKAWIGDSAGIEFAGMRRGKRDAITWKKNKDGAATDFRAAFEESQNMAALLLSGKLDEFTRAITVMDKFAQESFANTRATITADDVRTLLEQCREMLELLAKGTILAAHTKPKIGPRQFRVPSTWKKKQQKEEQ